MSELSLPIHSSQIFSLARYKLKKRPEFLIERPVQKNRKAESKVLSFKNTKIIFKDDGDNWGKGYGNDYDNVDYATD